MSSGYDGKSNDENGSYFEATVNKVTNWEKYFGTPERTAKMDVENYVDALTNAGMVRVLCEEKTVATVKARYYGVWLKSEADDER